VTKEQIIDSLWGRSVCSDEVLTTAVWGLRKALGDAAKEPLLQVHRPRLEDLGSAVAGGCACAVTGDGGLLALGAYQGIPILSPAEFWQPEDKLDRTGSSNPKP
jgi:hypothetical protein